MSAEDDIYESFLFHFLLTSKDVSKDCLRIPFSAEGFKMEPSETQKDTNIIFEELLSVLNMCGYHGLELLKIEKLDY